MSSLFDPTARETIRRLSAWAAMLAVACVVAFGIASPLPAYAFFDEASDESPAQQDLGEIGAVIYPQDIPEGQVFRVEARTSSRMCIIYENAADCSNRTNKEQCLIQRQGDTILVAFYMSQAYTHLYMGTAGEAAALTNADGTDDSAYIIGNPSTGYVPHLFNITIPALNYPMTMATYAGGSNGREVWYTREAVFKPTRDLLDAIEAAKNPPEPTLYTVTFTDGVGNVIATQSVEAGSAASAPAAPVRDGYVFAGWSVGFDQVNSDTTVDALWTEASSEGDDPGQGEGGGSEGGGSEGGGSEGEGSGTPEQGQRQNEQDAGQQEGDSGSSAADAEADADPNRDVGGRIERSETAEDGANAPAAASAGNPAPASDEPAAESSGMQTGASGAGASGTQAGTAAADANGAGDNASSEGSADSSQEDAGEGSESAETVSEDAAAEESSSSNAPSKAPEAKKGIRMSIAGFEFPELEGEEGEELVLEEKTARGLSPMQIMAIGMAALLVVGALWRALTFARGFDAPAPSESAAAASAV